MAGGRFYNINQYIKAEKVRLIDEDGKQLGILSTTEALKKARRCTLDLVEVAPKAEPPVCKIIDFRKFIYQQRKKRQDERKKRRQSGLKQIRFKLFIDEHDLERRIKKAEKFLKNGSKVKLSILLRGREITKQELGFDLLEKIKGELEETAKVSQEPKLRGRILEMTLGPR